MPVEAGREILSMKGITKVYANSVVANQNVNFSVNAGEIHAIMGENGAGKTTLMKILFGLEQADSGEIRIGGGKVSITSPLSAISHGIGMVHQHFMLVPSLTVAENMVLGMEPKKRGMVDHRQAAALAAEACKKYNFPLDPDARVQNLSVGSKQKLEILKALVRGAKILILDEPTAVLTPQETQELFHELLRFKESGFTIIFISHKLREIKEICDRITVMRNGRTMGVYNVSDVSEQDISRLMVGRDVVLTVDKGPPAPKEVILDVRGLTCKDVTGKLAVNGVSFSLRSGEILGVAGVEGNGQRQVVEAVTGLTPAASGEVTVCGAPIGRLGIREIRDLGLAHIPQDRMTLGVAKTASIGDNLLSDRMHRREFGGRFLINRRRIGAYIAQAVKDFRIKCATPNQAVESLSGGNIQKVVAARELSSGAKLIVADQPTRGVDVGATEFIRSKLVEMRDGGAGVLLISADLNEVMELSDRLIVLYNGEISAFFPDSSAVTEEELGAYMLGLKRQSPEEIGRVVHVQE